jgi:hypothetical protein
MNTRVIVAIILIALGVAGLGYEGISYTTRERVFDAGPIHVTAERQHTISVAPIAAGLLIIGGLALLSLGLRRKHA